MQIAECRRDFDDVGDGLVGRQRTVVRLADLLQRRAADVLHDDVADRRASGILVLDEVVDADDVRVFHFGEGQRFGFGGGHGVGVGGIDQTLEHHPAVVHVAVDRQVDPAESAVRDAAPHLVLPADQVAAGKLGNEREWGSARGAEALRATGRSVARPSDGLVAFGVAAEPLTLRNLRVGQDRRGWVPFGHRRYGDDSGAEAPASTGRFR